LGETGEEEAMTVFNEWAENRGTHTYRTRVGGAIIEATVYKRKGDSHGWKLRMTLAWYFDLTGEPRAMTSFIWPTPVHDNEMYYAHWKCCRDVKHGKLIAMHEIEAFKRDITKENGGDSL